MKNENVTTTGPTSAQAASDRYRELDINLLRESSTNPRKRFDEKKLAELAGSIKSKGVLQPLVVRPVNSHFEVVAGARRFRASKIAGLATVPARVRDLTDAEVLEVQLIENLQREEVHPLEESGGFARLLKQPNYTAEVLAKKIGHDAAYVYKRLPTRRPDQARPGGIPIRTDQPGPRSITGTSARRQTEGRLR
jgi:ParB family chromosome partitioning protein